MYLLSLSSFVFLPAIIITLENMTEFAKRDFIAAIEMRCKRVEHPTLDFFKWFANLPHFQTSKLHK